MKTRVAPGKPEAALELNVTPGALSHQIRGLEDHLGVKLFDRGVRSIALTPAGKALQPGLQAGFLHIRDAVASLNRLGDTRVLVISTSPGFTSKWLAPRLYRFSLAHPQICVRVSSSINNANFTTRRRRRCDPQPCGRCGARSRPRGRKLLDQSHVPVCSPAFVEKHGPFMSPDMLKRVPLIHDESLAGRAAMPTWDDWFAAAGVRDADVSRGLRFSSADHALDATVEGAGVLLALDALAYDDLRTGRLIMPSDLTLPSGRCYAFVCPKKRRDSANVRAFRAWLKEGGGRPRLEQACDARSRFPACGGIVRDAPKCENGKSAALVCGFDAIGSASLIRLKGRRPSTSWRPTMNWRTSKPTTSPGHPRLSPISRPT